MSICKICSTKRDRLLSHQSSELLYKYLYSNCIFWIELNYIHFSSTTPMFRKSFYHVTVKHSLSGFWTHCSSTHISEVENLNFRLSSRNHERGSIFRTEHSWSVVFENRGVDGKNSYLLYCKACTLTFESVFDFRFDIVYYQVSLKLGDFSGKST